MVVVATADMGLLRRGLQLALTDRAVGVAVELLEQRVNAGLVGAGADRLFELRLGNLAVAVGVELGHHTLSDTGGRASLHRQQSRNRIGAELRHACGTGGTAATRGPDVLAKCRNLRIAGIATGDSLVQRLGRVRWTRVTAAARAVCLERPLQVGIG